MSYLYYLAGENRELAKAEVEGFVETRKEQARVCMKAKMAETAAEPSQLKRLALTHEVSKKVCETEIDEAITLDCENSFAVRAENLSGRDLEKAEVERTLGSKIEKSNENVNVDLENPSNVFKAYILEDRVVVGKRVLDIDRGLFEKRKNQLRPFSSPVSLDPILARVMVNLSGVKPGEYVLDPFCGTGGILIEAGLCGAGVRGMDIKKEMKEGTERNLEEYGILNHDIRQGKISEIEEAFDESFDAVVTDLPYGNASKEVGQPVEAFLKFIEGIEIPVVFMWNQEELGDYTADYSVYVHKNLTRYIFVV